ncbi:MAG: hypothetical protein Q7U98_10430 [Methylicorpusculum sp.]|uniref:hypothetical protein n=1 Tax=Methylicorpusculum sp. TaxID=2713644 RepID=UPI00271DC1AE|nr:hypothetical protein [Methylicorpusculum sp.]MDO8939563.1 hypothetical protein [Methylicorpusculum sp.]MDO9239341.1 hypothetical protein [Methylicorpusculum sp.]MDP2178014.1 hypothetical protein [Methylicorpusculum sp.]MDP2201848.1 hypothetical protein [Methylicorpusculum sp.]MDP3528980.1 hypothetical protein [Methylicorpusculum sp.]
MANEEMIEFVESERKKRNEYNLIFNELAEREKQLQEQLAKQQAIISQQEAQLNENRNRLKMEQLLREKDFQAELEEREKLFEKRQESMFQRQKQMEEHFHQRLLETEELRNKLERELSERESSLKKAQEELENEKQKYTEESRRQIETKSETYVNTALLGLEQKEQQFHTISKLWSVFGALSIVVGIGFIIFASLNGAASFHNGNGFSWTYFLFITFRGLIVIGLFAALARYSFIFANSYMHESLKNGERRHAINFGKFYLEAFGANASWLQIKEAFQHWNIGNVSAFSKYEQKSSENEKPIEEGEQSVV